MLFSYPFGLNCVTYSNGARHTLSDYADVEKHLEKMGASALQVCDVIMFRKDVTISDVLEEVYHFEQNRKGVNSEKPEALRTILNEIDAKKYLISVAKRYKIPLEEDAVTRKQLAHYEKSLKEWSDSYEGY